MPSHIEPLTLGIHSTETNMENAWPLWALPFWTMGVPLIWAVVEKFRTPRPDAMHAAQPARPLAAIA